jgi:hypothetical protein
LWLATLGSGYRTVPAHQKTQEWQSINNGKV